jgi:small subunit ribosomal protein S16
MVKIRMQRGGAKKRPYYRVVVLDSRKPRETRVLEFLGTYAPIDDGKFSLREDAYARWVERGAQVSDTVAALVRRHRRSQAQSGGAAEA